VSVEVVDGGDRGCGELLLVLAARSRALEGIQLATELDFRVRVATTYLPEDAPAAGDLHGT